MGEDKAVVRMYNVGFGDCFLVKIFRQGKVSKVLFDCGSIKAGPASIDDVVQKVIDDVTDPDGKARIDVVVGTHRHKDHVSGFASGAWKNIEVKEVWMPWTEDPKDGDARKIRNGQSKLASALAITAQRKQAALAAAGDAAERLRVAGLCDLASNALSNEAAMLTLHEGFAGRPLRRFLPGRDGKESTFETGVLPGVTVHILGPSRDKDVIRDMDPPSGQSYLQLMDSGDPSSGVPDPFREDWWLDLEPPVAVSLGPDDRQKISAVGSDLDFNVAVALDKAVNGTSLMLILQIGDAYLLFPGDAQWGTWQAALENQDWKALLGRTTFYKIGHHGSHNATPVEFVENSLGKNFWAMASTHHVDQWPSIPKSELLEALRARTDKLARSDKDEEAPTGAFTVQHDAYVEATIPV
jgi:beta-lactamase superfamily II metal-dependent hydrolase